MAVLSNYQSSWFLQGFERIFCYSLHVWTSWCMCCLFISGSFSHFLSFLSITFQPLHSSSLGLVYCFECSEGCVFAWGPKSSFLLELGPCLWGWGAGRGDGQVDAASHKCWILTGMGPFKGSHYKWGHSASAVQLAFRQPRSHSYSALSFQYRLPLLTSLIAFSQSLGYVFDESIKTLCIAKQTKPKSHQGSGVLHCIISALCCIFTFLSALSPCPLTY